MPPRPTLAVGRVVPPSFPQGTAVWVPCPKEVWQAAEIVGIREGVLYALIDGAEVALQADQPIFVANVETMSEGGITSHDDLTQLSHLHEAAVLHSLNLRFDIDKIYTFTGPILIAVNPFKTIPGLYSFETLKSFVENPPQSVDQRIPHVFSTAIVAYRGLCCRHACQTILISGESGAGKTESTKFVMKLLAVAGSTDFTNRSQIENQVLQSNPLLEAFGNAKTLRNDNSSRFGKFIEMQFGLEAHGRDNKGRLAGARIHTYLLETVRVCHQLEGERNYHMFYQICAAAASKKCENGLFPMLKSNDGEQKFVDLSSMTSYSNFRYLTRSSCHKLNRVDDVEEFEATLEAMRTVGLPYEEICDVTSVLGAVLFVGNLTFKSLDGQSEASCVASQSIEHLNVAAKLLGITPKLLEEAFCFRSIRMRTEVIRKPLKVREAEDTRDALARALYNTMFLKIVKRTNASIGYKDDVSLFCGVLDIFGFECFEYNSFEQLCINFTNERLQQFFNTFIFKCEEELYKREKISWDPLDFPDNQDCVDILQGKPSGIFAMLDEECLVPQGSDRGFCNKLKEKHKDHVRFGIIKTKADWFTVNHFAGPVHYCSDGFLDKNKDQLSQDVQEAVKKATKTFVRNLFEEFLDRGTAESKKKTLVTVSSEFRQQLAYLMETIHRTEPHFIRCIKPNPRNKPDIFDRQGVTEQLRYGGVLQAVQVSRAGYPVRLANFEVVKDYRILLPRAEQTKLGFTAATADVDAKLILVYLDTALNIPKPKHAAQSWSIGTTLSFFKHEAFELLSAARAQTRDKAATRIQASWKGMTQRASFLHLRLCVTVIQAHVRGWLARREVQKLRLQRACRLLQCCALARIDRLRYEEIRASTLVVQCYWRGCVARRAAALIRRENAAVVIQRMWKGRQQAAKYRAKMAAILRIQTCRRGLLAKRQLKKLRLNARDTAQLKNEKERLLHEQLELKKKLDNQAKLASSQTSENDKLKQQVEELTLKVSKLSALVSSLEEQNRNLESQVGTPPSKNSDQQFASPPTTDATTRSATRPEDSPSDSSCSREKLPTAPTKRLELPTKVRSAEKESNDADPVGHEDAREDLLRVEKNLVEKKFELQRATSELEGAKEENQRLGTEAAKLRDANAEMAKELAELRQRLQESDERATAAAKDKVDLRQKLVDTEQELQVARRSKVSDPVRRLNSTLGGDSPLSRGSAKSYDVVLVGKTSYDLMSKTARECGVDDLELATSCRLSVPTGEGNTVIVGLSDATDRLPLHEQGNRELIGRAKTLVAVCDATCSESTQRAFNALKGGTDSPKYLFAIRHNAADMREIRDTAHRQGVELVEGGDTLLPLLTRLVRPKQNARNAATAKPVLYKNIFNMFFGSDKTGSRQQQSVFLRPSQLGTMPMLPKSKDLASVNAAHGYILPVQEVHDVDSAITFICFGQQKCHRNYILLAAGAKDGSVLVYRSYRTSMEVKMYQDQMQKTSDHDGRTEGTHTNRQDQQFVSVHTKMVGHSKAITSIFFSESEDNLVTTSTDRTVRFWSVATGDMLKVFSDSSPALVAAQLPFDANLFIAANANAVLRLVSFQNGSVIKKIKFESQVKTLRFDRNGINCFAGCKNGAIHVLDCPDSSDLKLRYRLPLTKVAITDITYIPGDSSDISPGLAVNSCDSSLSIVDIQYGNNGVISTLQVRCRFKVAQSLLPLRSTYSSFGGGWIVSASEDREVHVWSALRMSNTSKVLTLKHHTAPILTVAMNDQDTVLVSADTCGKIVLWRRFDFSHLAPQ